MRLRKTIVLFLSVAALTTFAHAGKGRQDANRTEYKTESSVLAFETKYEFSRTVGQGRLVKTREGKDGVVRKTYKVTFKDGKPVGKVLVGTQRVEPTHELYLMGKQGFNTSRGGYVRGKVMTMEATAYDPSAGRGAAATFRTRTGLPAKYGVVAVDPRIIKLGTMLYIEGYGFAKAADTGGAIKGNKIDLCVNTYREAMKFGRKKVKVHVLSSR